MLNFKPLFKVCITRKTHLKVDIHCKLIYAFQLSSAAVVYNVLLPCSGSPLTRFLTNCFDAKYSLK